jgi:fumarylpyruvate hydrolase
VNAFGTQKKLYKSAVDATSHVRNVFCVGRNYRDHALELGNQVPDRPLIFGKSTHAVVPAQNTLVLPEHRMNIHHELEIVLWIKSRYTTGSAVHELVDGVALGLDLTDRDAQSELKAKGQPWEYAKGFKGSAVISDFYQVADWKGLNDANFSLHINGGIVQSGFPRDMLFSLQTLVDYVGQHFGLDAGDVLFTGTPAGVGPLASGDVLELRMQDDIWANCQIA